MQIPAHIMSGWCIGGSLNTTPQERLACMLAASLPDLDGLGLFFGKKHYHLWHHVICHNLFFGMLLSVVCATLAQRGRRTKIFILCLGLFHLHLLMDLYGSGRDWGIRYFWPIIAGDYYAAGAWEFVSWQNSFTMGVEVCWIILIAHWKGWTPFELVAPGLESDWKRLRTRMMGRH